MFNVNSDTIIIEREIPENGIIDFNKILFEDSQANQIFEKIFTIGPRHSLTSVVNRIEHSYNPSMLSKNHANESRKKPTRHISDSESDNDERNVKDNKENNHKDSKEKKDKDDDDRSGDSNSESSFYDSEDEFIDNHDLQPELEHYIHLLNKDIDFVVLPSDDNKSSNQLPLEWIDKFSKCATRHSLMKAILEVEPQFLPYNSIIYNNLIKHFKINEKCFLEEFIKFKHSYLNDLQKEYKKHIPKDFSSQKGKKLGKVLRESLSLYYDLSLSLNNSQNYFIERFKVPDKSTIQEKRMSKMVLEKIMKDFPHDSITEYSLKNSIIRTSKNKKKNSDEKNPSINSNSRDQKVDGEISENDGSDNEVIVLKHTTPPSQN